MIKNRLSCLLALILCISFLPAAVQAADPVYSVSSVTDSAVDPDILAVMHLDSNADFAVNRDSNFSAKLYSTHYTNAPSPFGKCLSFSTTGSSSLTISSSIFSELSSFCLDFHLYFPFNSKSTFAVRTKNSGVKSASDLLYLSPGDCRFLNSNDVISSASLYSAFYGSLHSVRILYIDGVIFLFSNGDLLCSDTYLGDSISCLYFEFYSSYGTLDEIILSTGKYTENLDSYTPATAPFDAPFTPVLPDDPVDNCVYVFSSLPAGSLILDTVPPDTPAAGDVWLCLDSEKRCTSAQIYDGSSWSDVVAALYSGGTTYDVLGYQFAVGSPDDPDNKPDAGHMFLTTPFEDYTVTEGLLLALLLCTVAAAVIKILKEGFYWLW